MIEIPEITPLPTQVHHPWKTTIRTMFQALIAFASMAPFIYAAATGDNADEATGWSVVGLGIAAGISRVMAIPAVNEFIVKFIPFLSAN